MNTYKPQEFAEMVGVSVKTLQRWDNEGKLKAFRTPSNRRYYTHNQYVEYMGERILTFSCDSDISYNELLALSKNIGGVKIVKSIQNRDKSNTTTNSKN